MTFLKQILSDQTINDQERSLYEKCFTDLNQKEDVNKCIYHLKKDLSILSVNHQLSKNGLNYFTELTRIEPSTSVSSMWNFLVRK